MVSLKKRLAKKLYKKKEQLRGYIYAEGNKGADFIEIEDLKDGTLKIRSGSCCVYSMDSIVPVEFLTAILSNVITKHGDAKQVIDSFGWDSEFKDELKLKIQDTRFYYRKRKVI